jgi:hypothetical protein
MKKLFLTIVLMLLLSTSAFAASETLTFAWDYNQVDLQYLKGWTLYWSGETGKNFSKVVDIPYAGTGTETVFTSPVDLTVTGTQGSTVTKYFYLTAVNKDNLESVPSNEVSKGFYIPYNQLPSPFNLIIKVMKTP